MAFLTLPKTNPNAVVQTVINLACIESVQFYYHDKNDTGVITIFSTGGGEPIKYTFQGDKAGYDALKLRVVNALAPKNV
jgi:hypothetical protein